MARRQVGQRKEMEVEFANYCYLLDGIAGIGKTTVAYEIGRKLYGEDGFLLLTMGQEPLPKHLGGIFNDRAKDWTELDAIVNDLVTYRTTDYKKLRLIGVDTVDELCRLAEEEAITLYNASVGIDKRVKSISQAFGGFQKGENKVVDLITNTIFKLRDAGYGIFFIGHTKTKSKKDTMMDVEYEQLTSNLDAKYYNAIKDKVNVVGCAYIEREMNDLETVKDAFSKKDKKVGRVASERRVIVFRDEEYAIDVKSHFEEIEAKIDFGADEFINAIMTAIKKQKEKYSFTTAKTIEKTIEKPTKIEKEVVVEDIIEDIVEDIIIADVILDNEDNNPDEVNEEKSKVLIKDIATKYADASQEIKDKIKAILVDNHTKKFDPKLPVRVFEEILVILK